MTQGKMMLLIVILYIVLVVVVGEIIYRYRYRRLKKEMCLSDRIAKLLTDRNKCYGIVLIAIFRLLILMGVVWVVITKWSTPI